MGVEKKVYSFRFSEEMVQSLQKYANEENRSLSNFVETILKNYLNKKNNSKKKVIALRAWLFKTYALFIFVH